MKIESPEDIEKFLEDSSTLNDEKLKEFAEHVSKKLEEEKRQKKHDEILSNLLVQLLDIIKEFGTKSDQLYSFIDNNTHVTEFREMAAAMIYVIEEGTGNNNASKKKYPLISQPPAGCKYSRNVTWLTPVLYCTILIIAVISILTILTI